MVEALTLSRRWEIIKVGETLAFPGSISRDSAKQLSGSADEVFRNVFTLLENLVLSVIEKRTAGEFKGAAESAFPKYLDAAIALSALTRLLVQQPVIERLNREFFCELEADLREHGLGAFGEAVRDQAMFTVWTLRKLSDLTSQMVATPLPQLDSKQTATFTELAAPCIYHAVRTRFYLNCLVTSMQKQVLIHPEALEIVIDGLRSVVNAYGLARRLVDLLVPLVAPEIAPVDWDEEDQQLLAEATRDMAFESAI